MMGVKIREQQFKAFLNGDEEGFRYFLVEESPKLHGFIRKFVKSHMDAEEIAQDVFVELWRERDKIKTLKNFFGHMYQSARFKSLNHLRNFIPDEIELKENILRLDDVVPDAESYFEAAELTLLIEAAIELMPEQRKKVFMMSRFEGLKRAEIAEKLGISPNTVSRHMTDALDDIKKIIVTVIIISNILR